MGWADMRSVVPIAERAALAAVEADTEDAWTHHGLAYTSLCARRFDDAVAEFELALRLNPNFSLAQAFYGAALCYSGRWEEGDMVSTLGTGRPAAQACGLPRYHARRSFDGAWRSAQHRALRNDQAGTLKEYPHGHARLLAMQHPSPFWITFYRELIGTR